MGRTHHIVSLMLLAAGAILASDQKAPKEPPPPPPPKPAKAPAPKGGQPKAFPKGAQRLINPTNVVTRLYRMTPEQRDRAIEKWPAQQQDAARKNLAWFDTLPKEQQDMQLRRIERFEQLSPEKRVEVRTMVKAANQLPPPRRALVGRAIWQLQQMTDQQRENTLQRPQFQSRFSPEELKIITSLADAWMEPQ